MKAWADLHVAAEPWATPHHLRRRFTFSAPAKSGA
jgi:hypothetical protein